MYKLTILLLLVFCNIALQAQTFQELITEGDKLYSEKDYQASAETYIKAFALKEAEHSGQYYNAACSWALAGNSDEAFKYLKLAADKGWRNVKHTKNDKDLNSLHELPHWEEAINLVQANLEEYEKDFDKPLKAQLEAVYVRDQMLRRLYKDAEEKFGRESEEMEYFWDLVAREDSINEMEVLKIIDERGWIGKSTVGDQANTTVWLVVQHAPLETQEKYLPLLRESVKKGESRGSHLALLEDRIMVRNDKPQIYGSQVGTDKETGKYYVYDIKEPEYVNQRRAAVGLGTIQDYVKRWDIEWTIEQKEK